MRKTFVMVKREHKKRTKVLAKECIDFGIPVVAGDLFTDLQHEVDKQLEIVYAKLRREPKKI